MIVTQSPLRVSLFGGGTDFAGYYERDFGCVLSTAIDKYIYVVVKQRFDDKIYVNYSRKEIVDQVDDLQHELVREAMRSTGVKSGVEITTLADIPSEGTGLGSSSCVLVGLLTALSAYQGEVLTRHQLAEEACRIEIEVLGKPIGKQDQYLAAFGGFRFVTFRRDGGVDVENVSAPGKVEAALMEHLMLVYTNRTRQANTILAEQSRNIESRLAELDALRDMAVEARKCLDRGDLWSIGHLLHESWRLKKTLAKGIADDEIEEIYAEARRSGALGGKITGAGGGGFMLLFVPPERRRDVRSALAKLRELPIGVARDGSKVIFDMRR